MVEKSSFTSTMSAASLLTPVPSSARLSGLRCSRKRQGKQGNDVNCVDEIHRMIRRLYFALATSCGSI